MEGHKYGVYSLILSKSNKWLFSGSTDNTIGVWTCKSRKHERFLDGHKSTVVGLILSQNENFLFSMAKNGWVFSWNLKTFKISKKLHAFSASNSSLCFCLSDPLYTIFGRDIHQKGTLRAVNLLSGETVKSIKIHKKSIRCMILDNNNQFLYTGGTDGFINVLTVTNSEIIKKIKAHNAPINSLTVSKDDRYLVTASDDHLVKIFDVQNDFAFIRELKHKVEVSYVMFSSKNKHLLTGGWNHKPIKIWDLDWLDITEQNYKFAIPGKHYLIQSAVNWNKDSGKTTQQKVKENIVNFEDGMKNIDNYALTKTTLDYLDSLSQMKSGIKVKRKNKLTRNKKSTTNELDPIKDIIFPEIPIGSEPIIDKKILLMESSELLLNKKLDLINKKESTESSKMESLAVSHLKNNSSDKNENENEGTIFKTKGLFKKRIL